MFLSGFLQKGYYETHRAQRDNASNFARILPLADSLDGPGQEIWMLVPGVKCVGVMSAGDSFTAYIVAVAADFDNE